MHGIVSTAWLHDHLEDHNLRIIDARGSFSTYQAAHIPGAQMLHIETLRMSDHGVPCKMFPPEILAIIFGRLGISQDTPVVAYATNPTDHISASYTIWSLAVSGNHAGLLLDGGLDKWKSEALPLTQIYPTIEPTNYMPHFDDTIFADWQYIRDHLDDPNLILVDTRSQELYTGEAGTTQRLGHIPGAVHHNYIYDFGRDGTYLPEEKLRKRYEDIGVTPDKEIITYCVTGREGSAAWFTLKRMLDYPRVRLYQASITEWAALTELPMVTGNTPYGTWKAA